MSFLPEILNALKWNKKHKFDVSLASNNKAIKILSLDSTWFWIIEVKRWQNNLELVYSSDFTISFSLAIFKLQVVCTLNGAEGMQNKIFLRSNSALSVSGSYVGHVTANFIFAAVPAVILPLAPES